MDFKWFYQRYFGTPGFPTMNPGDNDYDSKGHTENNKTDVFEHSFHYPFEDFIGDAHDIFQHVEDMFNKMFSASFRPSEFSQFEGNMLKETDPRSIMLKDPDCSDCHPNADLSPCKRNEPATLVDSDIDDKVTEQGIFQMNPLGERRGSHNFFFKKFSSVKTVHLLDGVVEEHRTTTDSKGNKITTIRQSIGDQSYEVTTQFNESGLKEKEEKEENFENMDESDLPEFKRKLEGIKGSKMLESPLHSLSSSNILKLPTSSADPLYLSLFKKFFGSPDKSDN
ncbi:uncharacterized protein LOC118201600 [Stegodyphus dumicola]|uniref:uncharacterized protein LOC118201600 n=1 Tax=Stegodyphus dumicola TaxID=202533 RepID=UPI0015A9B2D1|nr:uncharacterized protein LOC118201600 [Stegodyphus dumicola]